MAHLPLMDARDRMLERIASTRTVLDRGLPHWASGETGEWITTPDGDWTGGAYIGELWLAHLIDPARFSVADAHEALSLMEARLPVPTAFKGFGYYFGAATASTLFGDARSRDLALRAADVLVGMFDARLGLIPLGASAEEAAAVGTAESSIDSLQAYALLAWAFDETQDPRYNEIATLHLGRVLDIHVRDDGSVIQSSTLDPATGEVLRTHTHKGYSDTSVWGRAQGWAMLYASQAAVNQPDEPRWRDIAVATVDWWISHAPADHVAYWDFDDPAIPDTARDTAATAMFAAAALRLSAALGDQGGAYRAAAERTVQALVDDHLTPTADDDDRPVGMLTGGCFTRKPEARSQDRTPDDVELIFGTYFAFESIAILTGALEAGRI